MLGSSARNCVSLGSSGAACSAGLPCHASVQKASRALPRERRTLSAVAAMESCRRHHLLSLVRRASSPGALAALHCEEATGVGCFSAVVAKQAPTVRRQTQEHLASACMCRRLLAAPSIPRRRAGARQFHARKSRTRSKPHRASSVFCGCFGRVRRGQVYAWKRVQHRALRRRDERAPGHFCTVPRGASVAARAPPRTARQANRPSHGTSMLTPGNSRAGTACSAGQAER